MCFTASRIPDALDVLDCVTFAVRCPTSLCETRITLQLHACAVLEISVLIVSAFALQTRGFTHAQFSHELSFIRSELRRRANRRAGRIRDVTH